MQVYFEGVLLYLQERSHGFRPIAASFGGKHHADTSDSDSDSLPDLPAADANTKPLVIKCEYFQFIVQQKKKTKKKIKKKKTTTNNSNVNE